MTTTRSRWLPSGEASLLIWYPLTPTPGYRYEGRTPAQAGCVPAPGSCDAQWQCRSALTPCCSCKGCLLWATAWHRQRTWPGGLGNATAGGGGWVFWPRDRISGFPLVVGPPGFRASLGLEFDVDARVDAGLDGGDRHGGYGIAAAALAVLIATSAPRPRLASLLTDCCRRRGR